MRPQPILALGALALLVPATGVSPAMSVGAPLGLEVRPLIIGFHAVPTVAPGDLLLGATVVEVNRALRFAVVDAPAGFVALAALDPNVRYVEPDGENRALDFTPNDPRYSQQYGPQQVNAPAAWDHTLGSERINVCIVDTGVRYTHEDLRDRWLGGSDFVNKDDDPWDDNGHGTHVAGIAAAGLDNGVGIAGLANVGILGVKVLSASGGGSKSDTASGIQWCADHDADVINLSLGGAPAQVERDAVRYAWDKGALVVAASGNSGPCNDCVSSPADYDEAIAVSCTDRTEAFCHFEWVAVAGTGLVRCGEEFPDALRAQCAYAAASTGPEVELSAPGRFILSSCFESDDAYCKKSGTSMSTPHVSGVAALVWSARPTLANCQMRQILRSTAADLGAPGWDEQFGHGRVDAGAALDAVLDGQIPPLNCASRDAPVCRILVPRPGVELRGLAPIRVYSESAISTVARVEIFVDGALAMTLAPDGNGDYAGALDTTAYAEGPRALEARCTDTESRTRTTTRAHAVDQTLDPTVEILSPPEGATVGGVVPVEVYAVSNGGTPLSVAVKIDNGPWADISTNRVGDRYYYVWDATLVPSRSTVWAKATDAAGETQTWNKVGVYALGYNALQFVDCVDDLQWVEYVFQRCVCPEIGADCWYT